VTNLIALHSFGARPFCFIVSCMYFGHDKQTDFLVAIKAGGPRRTVISFIHVGPQTE
jgi:hypothetical protein